jgi:hypothetical protein
MASWITPVSHATGDVLSVNDWNTVAGDVQFLYQSPYGLFYASSTASVTATASQMPLDTLRASNYGVYATSNNVTLPLSGVYQVNYALSVSNSASVNANARMFASLYYNGGSYALGSKEPLSLSNPTSTGSALVVASAGDTVALWGTSQITVLSQANIAGTFLHVVFLGST